MGFSLVVASGAHTLVLVCGLLLAAERGLWSTRASVFAASGSVVVVHGLGCPTACGVLVP